MLSGCRVIASRAPIRKYVEEETKNITTGKMPAIRACVLTNDAGVIGAAALANSI